MGGQAAHLGVTHLQHLLRDLAPRFPECRLESNRGTAIVLRQLADAQHQNRVESPGACGSSRGSDACEGGLPRASEAVQEHAVGLRSVEQPALQLCQGVFPLLEESAVLEADAHRHWPGRQQGRPRQQEELLPQL